MIKFIAGYIWTQIQTTIHKMWVMWYSFKFCSKLMWRAIKHDNSKYLWVEAKGFASTIFDLKHSTYGSDEYKKLLQQIQPCLKHHYFKNSHHPEFHKDVKDMTILDKIELCADWKSATRRHKDGDIKKSLEINKKRFGFSEEDMKMLTQIAKIIDKNI